MIVDLTQTKLIPEVVKRLSILKVDLPYLSATEYKELELFILMLGTIRNIVMELELDCKITTSCEPRYLRELYANLLELVGFANWQKERKKGMSSAKVLARCKRGEEYR